MYKICINLSFETHISIQNANNQLNKELTLLKTFYGPLLAVNNREEP